MAKIIRGIFRRHKIKNGYRIRVLDQGSNEWFVQDVTSEDVANVKEYSEGLSQAVRTGKMKQDQAIRSLKNFYKGDQRFFATKDSFFTVMYNAFQVSDDLRDKILELEEVVSPNTFDLYYNSDGYGFDQVFNYKERSANPELFNEENDTELLYEIFEEFRKYVGDDVIDDILNDD